MSEQHTKRGPELFRIPRDQYETLVMVDTQEQLTEMFPEAIYVVMYDGEIIEMAPNITDNMRALGFTDAIAMPSCSPMASVKDVQEALQDESE